MFYHRVTVNKRESSLSGQERHSLVTTRVFPFPVPLHVSVVVVDVFTVNLVTSKVVARAPVLTHPW